MIMTPFMKKDEHGNNRANLIRIFEGIMITLGSAGIMFLLAYIWMIPTIKVDVESINKNIIEIKNVIGNQENRIRTVEFKVATLEARRSH